MYCGALCCRHRWTVAHSLNCTHSRHGKGKGKRGFVVNTPLKALRYGTRSQMISHKDYTGYNYNYDLTWWCSWKPGRTSPGSHPSRTWVRRVTAPRRWPSWHHPGCADQPCRCSWSSQSTRRRTRHHQRPTGSPSGHGCRPHNVQRHCITRRKWQHQGKIAVELTGATVLYQSLDYKFELSMLSSCIFSSYSHYRFCFVGLSTKLGTKVQWLPP